MYYISRCFGLWPDNRKDLCKISFVALPSIVFKDKFYQGSKPFKKGQIRLPIWDRSPNFQINMQYQVRQSAFVKKNSSVDQKVDRGPNFDN